MFFFFFCIHPSPLFIYFIINNCWLMVIYALLVKGGAVCVFYRTFLFVFNFSYDFQCLFYTYLTLRFSFYIVAIFFLDIFINDILPPIPLPLLLYCHHLYFYFLDCSPTEFLWKKNSPSLFFHHLSALFLYIFFFLSL